LLLATVDVACFVEPVTWEIGNRCKRHTPIIQGEWQCIR
jgi:hypothetical protein